MITHRLAYALGGIAALALLVPVVVLATGGSGPGLPPLRSVAPIAPQPPPELASALDRPLFAEGGRTSTASKDDGAEGPRLIGIAGRLGSDAVAMIKGADGVTHSLRIGQTLDGWRVESIARDAALLTRGSERRRLEVPGGGGDEG